MNHPQAGWVNYLLAAIPGAAISILIKIILGYNKRLTNAHKEFSTAINLSSEAILRIEKDHQGANESFAEFHNFFIKEYKDVMGQFSKELKYATSEFNEGMKSFKESSNRLFTDIRSTIKIGMLDRHALDIISRHERHGRFIEKFLVNSMQKKEIHDVQPEAFYSNVVELLQSTKTWETVQIGALSSLISNGFPDKDYARYYYNLFNKPSITTKRRVMIINKEEMRELEDDNLVEKFNELPGKYIETFYTPFERANQFLAIIGGMEDWSLFDKEIVLQYDRHKKIMRIYYHSDNETQTVIDMFNELDKSKDHSSAFLFFKLDGRVLVPTGCR
jgi:hypothetical protein